MFSSRGGSRFLRASWHAVTLVSFVARRAAFCRVVFLSLSLPPARASPFCCVVFPRHSGTPAARPPSLALCCAACPATQCVGTTPAQPCPVCVRSEKAAGLQGRADTRKLSVTTWAVTQVIQSRRNLLYMAEPLTLYRASTLKARRRLASQPIHHRWPTIAGRRSSSLRDRAQSWPPFCCCPPAAADPTASGGDGEGRAGGRMWPLCGCCCSRLAPISAAFPAAAAAAAAPGAATALGARAASLVPGCAAVCAIAPPMHSAPGAPTGSTLAAWANGVTVPLFR